ncbi:MAG TPA: acyl-CoA dehydrogenase family protein [Dehalococcoidia bacterium]|nr:acyl-CoA dehydrogenase family protein [Dehalococcoidia bacterium]
MDFALTEDQQIFQRMVRDFATNEIEPVAAQVDEEEKFPAENVRKMAELGLMGVSIAEEYGGSGGDSMHLVIATEEIARACASTSTIFLASLSLACYPIYLFGTEEQKRRFVVPVAKGQKLACFALTEPGAGSDAAAIQTTATLHGDHYVLDGTKIFITNGAEADIAVVFATADKSLRHKGIVALMVEKGTPGFSVGKKERKLGVRGSSTAELVFQSCQVPVGNRLGEEGGGFRVAMGAIDASRINVAAQAVGIARAGLEASLAYAQDRQQFGQAISGFQAVQWMLADMATQVDAARLLAYRAAFLKNQGLPYLKEAAMAKLFAAETAMSVTTKAVQIHGGYGYIKDYPVERYFRDAKITEIYEGTSEMQRMTIAKQLIG